MAFDPSLGTVRTLAKSINSRRTKRGFAAGNRERWTEWWTALRERPELATQFAERSRRFPTAHGSEPEYLAHFHEAALRDAGFREVATIWQNIDNRVLLAVA